VKYSAGFLEKSQHMKSRFVVLAMYMHRPALEQDLLSIDA
jgi:hypothetical protein